MFLQNSRGFKNSRLPLPQSARCTVVLQPDLALPSGVSRGLHSMILIVKMNSDEEKSEPYESASDPVYPGRV
jgi:hypothetical protein